MPQIDVRSGPSYGTLDSDPMEQHTEDEGDRLLRQGYETDGHASDSTSEDSIQEGVRKIEAINLTWTTKSLIIAYIRCVPSSAACRGYH